MRHIMMNYKNCLNIESKDSVLDYAFMFSIIESCGMNKFSPNGILGSGSVVLHFSHAVIWIK